MLPAPTTIVAAEQRRLDRDRAPAQRRVQMGAVEARVERLEAEPGEQLGGDAGRPPTATRRRRRSGADRSGAACRCAVTRSKWSCGPGAGSRVGEGERARHAQVQQQAAALERQPEVLAAALDLGRRVCADELLAARRRAASAAACRGARAVTRAPAMRSAKLQAGDFDFGEFGHGIASGGELSRGRRIGPRGGTFAARASPALAPATTRIVFRPRSSSMPALRVHPGRLRLPALLLALAAAGLASPARRSRSRPSRCSRRRPRLAAAGRELEPRRAAVLPAAARRDRAAQRRQPAPPTSCCSTPPGAPGRSAVPPRHRHRPAGARRRPGAGRGARLARGACPTRSRRCAIRCRCWSRSIASPRPKSRSASCCARRPRPALPGMIAAVPRFLGRSQRPQRRRRADRARRCSRTPMRRTRGSRRCVAIGRGWLAVPATTAKALELRAAAPATPNPARRRPGPARARAAAGDARRRSDRQGAHLAARRQRRPACACSTCARWPHRSA